MKEQAQCEPAAEAVEHKQPASPAPTEPDTNHTHRIKTSYGAGLAASRPLSAGSLVLTLDAPHLLLVEKDSLARVCSFCMREAPTVKRCSACKTPHYCGKACQHGHWRAHHGRECGLLKKLPEVPPTAVRALMAMLVSREKGTRGGEEGDWKGLESHVGRWQRDGERWEEMLWQARAGIEFTQSGPERMEEAIAYLGVVGQPETSRSIHQNACLLMLVPSCRRTRFASPGKTTRRSACAFRLRLRGQITRANRTRSSCSIPGGSPYDLSSPSRRTSRSSSLTSTPPRDCEPGNHGWQSATSSLARVTGAKKTRIPTRHCCQAKQSMAREARIGGWKCFAHGMRFGKWHSRSRQPCNSRPSSSSLRVRHARQLRF